MLKHRSPSLAISLLALFVALGGAGYSATGGNFLLGKTNTATTQTRLVAPPLGVPSLRIDNISTLPSTTGIRIVTNAARPPLAVNSSVKVVHLNADKLDGLDSTNLSRTTIFGFGANPFGISDPIPLPVTDRPILFMGGEISQPSAGQVTLLGRSGAPDQAGGRPLRGSLSPALYWVGLESGGTGITSGGTAIAGTHIFYLDPDHSVDMEVGPAGTIQFHNHSNSYRVAHVTLVW